MNPRLTDRRQFLIGSARRSRGSVLIRNQAMRKGRPVAFPDVCG